MTTPEHAHLVHVPPRAPRVKPSRLARWIGRTILRLGGWRVVGTLPDEPRLVMIGAPHSSNWDGIWGFAAKAALGLDIRVLGKDSLFRIPLLGWLLRKLGVIPLDRSRAFGVVQQAAAAINGPQPFWYGLAPEGTRKPVERWKPGFLKIAKMAKVPILPLYLHYPDKIIGFGPLFYPGDDVEADMAEIRAWYAPYRGKHRGTT